jgi:serine/threonine-protein kinase
MLPEVETLKSPEDEQTRRARARVGQTVRGRWRLDALLGMGGMAAVYAATHRNGKRVAVKMLHAELSASPEVKQRFIDEGYAANRVGHPAAVSVLDDDIAEDGAVFLVMDLLEGETLESRIRRNGRIEPDELLLIIDVLLDVLAAAHDKGIVHRDVKPDNIFITDEGKVKLLDFGIARMVEPGRPRTTQSGATMGTPAFMPPEQARGRWEQLDGRTDIWAVGATMFVALTGRQVHQGETVNEELLAAMTQPAPSVRELAPLLPTPLIDLVNRALAFDQDQRWSDAREMRAAARTVLAFVEDAPISASDSRSLSPTVPPVDSAPPLTLLTPHGIVAKTLSTVPPSEQKKARRMVVSGLAVAAALLIIFVATRGSKTRTPVAPEVTTVSAVGGALPQSPATAPEPPLAPAPAIEPVHSESPTDKVKTEKTKPAKAHAVPNVRPAASTSSVPAAAAPPVIIAPRAEPQVPSVGDPLDRRK